MEVKVGDLAQQIANGLSEYSNDVAEKVKNATDTVAKNLLKNIRNDAPERTRKYKKAMRIKTVYEGKFEKRVRWYVAKSHAFLPQMLERGHVTRNGGRTRAFPHIRKNEEKAKNEFRELIERAIKGGG